MTPQQLIGIALRLAALWLGMVSFQVYGIVHALFKGMDAQPSGLSLLAICPFLVLALVLWFVPMLIAHKLLPARQGTDGASFALQDCAAALTVMVGIYAAVSAMPTLAAGLIVHVFEPDPMFSEAYFGARGVKFLEHLSRFGIGLGLILLARPLSHRVFPSRPPSSV